MSTLQIAINTGNAAFGDDATGEHDPFTVGREIARILRRMADQFEHIGEATAPRDINGHQVGIVEWCDVID